jgi:acyl-CoA thioester hydrolase
VSPPFVHELRVRYGECDPQGIVFNANYLLYFDVAFTEYWRERIMPWQEMVAGGTDAVVAEANVRFRAPARFDDLLALQVTTEEVGTTSTTTRVDVVRDGEDLRLMELELVEPYLFFELAPEAAERCASAIAALCDAC